jgi:predicted permease
MDNVIMLFACLAIGAALRWGNRVPDNAHTSINAFIIHVSLPALTLLQIHAVKLDPALFYAALMPWLLFAASALLFGGRGLGAAAAAADHRGAGGGGRPREHLVHRPADCSARC